MRSLYTLVFYTLFILQNESVYARSYKETIQNSFATYTIKADPIDYDSYWATSVKIKFHDGRIQKIKLPKVKFINDYENNKSSYFELIDLNQDNIKDLIIHRSGTFENYSKFYIYNRIAKKYILLNKGTELDDFCLYRHDKIFEENFFYHHEYRKKTIKQVKNNKITSTLKATYDSIQNLKDTLHYQSPNCSNFSKVQEVKVDTQGYQMSFYPYFERSESSVAQIVISNSEFLDTICFLKNSFVLDWGYLLTSIRMNPIKHLIQFVDFNQDGNKDIVLLNSNYTNYGIFIFNPFQKKYQFIKKVDGFSSFIFDSVNNRVNLRYNPPCSTGGYYFDSVTYQILENNLSLEKQYLKLVSSDRNSDLNLHKEYYFNYNKGRRVLFKERIWKEK